MKEIQRVSITDAVVENIKGLIESNVYAIGEKLPTEANFCEQLKVSRTSVREAFRVLQALGYVENKMGKGAFVADYRKAKSERDPWYDAENARFYDFMEVRMAIETLSVRLAVERVTYKQLQELKQIHESFVEANENRDFVKMIMLDELFHTKIISCTDNPLLININKQLLEKFRIYRGDSFMDKTVYKNAVEPHSRILFCFETKNASLAVEEMRRHLEITGKDMEVIHSKHQNK